MIDFVVHGAFMLYAISFMMGLATIFTWVERKQSALMSDRIGANRCYIRVPFTDPTSSSQTKKTRPMIAGHRPSPAG